MMTTVLLFGLLLTAPACGWRTAPSQFYALGAMDGPAPPKGDGSGPRVSVGPVTIPDYLNRPQIVVREGEHRLVLDEYHRWGGSLEEEFLRILSENLGLLLGSEHVRAYSEEFQRSDYQVSVSLQRFEGLAAGDAVLKASWAILDAASRDLLMTREGFFRKPAARGNYASIVAAQSAALGALSREIAADILKVRSAGTP